MTQIVIYVKDGAVGAIRSTDPDVQVEIFDTMDMEYSEGKSSAEIYHDWKDKIKDYEHPIY